MKHMHKWIESLMEMLDDRVSPDVRIEIFEACGRGCVPQSFIRSAQACKHEAEDDDDFLKRLSKVWGHLKIDGKKVYAVYEKCYCPLVRAYPGELSSTFCNCSRGWIKELFESALGREVDVEILSTIRRGDDVCRFEIRL